MAELSEHHESKERPSGLAILFSAVIFPGVGQYMQRRHLIGSFYAAAFLFCVGFWFRSIFTPLFLNLRMLRDLASAADFYPIPWKNILHWTAISLLVYLANLLDVYLCYMKLLAKWLRR